MALSLDVCCGRYGEKLFFPGPSQKGAWALDMRGIAIMMLPYRLNLFRGLPPTQSALWGSAGLALCCFHLCLDQKDEGDKNKTESQERNWMNAEGDLDSPPFLEESFITFFASSAQKFFPHPPHSRLNISLKSSLADTRAETHSALVLLFSSFLHST